MSGEGLFHSFVTPVRYTRPHRSEEERRDQGLSASILDALPIKHVIYLVILPLAFFLLTFQMYLTYRATGAIKLLDAHRSKLPTSTLNMSVLGQIRTDLKHMGVFMGYVETTIPDAVVNFLAEAEKDLDNFNESNFFMDDAMSTNVYIAVEAEADHVRLSPVRRPGSVVVTPFPEPPQWDPETEFTLIWDYNAPKKESKYHGNQYWARKFENGTRAWYNSIATFPYVSNEAPYRYHGRLGVYPNGTQAWTPAAMPPPVDEAPQGRAKAMSQGGFYLDLTNALPLDREPDDNRDEICKKVEYNYTSLGDASIIITFYNEPLSTLLRSVHSVLNQTPPSLIREIILVDDHSNLTENLPGGDLYDYIKLLPKVKLMRLPERRGLVWARLLGAQTARADVLVVLDSHIEVNYGWLEPQLLRLRENPESIVFPQIYALDAEDFSYHKSSGIGCWLSWKWNMVEQASLTPSLNNTDPIPSASMAGGLFAVKRQWFWEVGGYDEQLSMWGSENVEMGFRVWQCWGRLECTPCSRTYHIYRKDGVGYSSPRAAVQRNKLRTARAWMDEWFQVATKFLGSYEVDMGTLDNILALKKELNCRNFKWFLENVDPTHDVKRFDDIELFGEIRNTKYDNMCVDLVNGAKNNVTYGIFGCHGLDGTQGFFKVSTNKKIRSFLDETKCLGRANDDPMLWDCWGQDVDEWTIEKGHLVYGKGSDKEACMAIVVQREDKKVLAFVPCDTESAEQVWTIQQFSLDPNYASPDFSLAYKKIHAEGNFTDLPRKKFFTTKDVSTRSTIDMAL